MEKCKQNRQQTLTPGVHEYSFVWIWVFEYHHIPYRKHNAWLVRRILNRNTNMQMEGERYYGIEGEGHFKD